jgi:DNA helicase-2/ATP-dependent DNA helicase PcrA
MDLSGLNDKQKEAVTAPLGPVLVLAGAGSGKTRALAYRIAFLCNEKIVEPEHILSLTFTNKAAREMQERVKSILKNQPISIPHMGTFHSMCARILRQEISRLGYTRGFIIADSDDQLKIIREICQELSVNKKFSPNFFHSRISMAKNILQTPDEMEIGLEPDLANLVQEVYRRYQNFLYNQNTVDFDDLLMLTVKIFQNFPDVLAKYRSIFQYILVDEYQDTNHAQYVFLYLLAEEHHNLFVVGDDAQSIYGFRGSNIRNILNFEEDFSETLVIKLEQNYRSSKNILAVAQKVIELNKDQKQKTLWTENDHGTKVVVEELEDERDEAVFVARNIIKSVSGTEGLSSLDSPEMEYEPEEPEESFSILDHFLRKNKKKFSTTTVLAWSGLPELPKDHGPLTEIAVLFRTHSQSRALEEVLIQCAIPYQIVGGVKYYDRKEIKDVLAYLRLTLNYRDLLSIKRVINEPARGIGEKSYQAIKEYILSQSISVESGNSPLPVSEFITYVNSLPLGSKAAKGAVEFFRNIERFSQLPEEEHLPSLLRLIVKTVQFEEWLRDGTEMGEARWENVQELFTVVEKYKTMAWKEGLSQFLEEVALITEIDDVNESKDCVTLMTLHSAKGLEFDTVFLTGLEEGVLPHSRSLFSPAELSEEIRLAYVGLTRARKNLYITYAKRRSSFGSTHENLPSRILRALPQDKISFRGQSMPSDEFDQTSEYRYDTSEDKPEEMPF